MLYISTAFTSLCYSHVLLEMEDQNVIELQEFEPDIHRFVEENNVVAVNNFLQGHNTTDKRNDLNQTALHIACEIGSLEIAELLLKKGANVFARDVDDFTPLIAASRSGNLPIAKLLISYQANIEHVDKNGWTSLMWATYKGHGEVVQFMLLQGANIHVTVAYNMTCLLWAAGRGHTQIVQMLCEKGSKANHTDKFGNTALFWACRRGYVDIAQCLLDYEADPNIVGSNGSSPLLNAMKGNYTDCVSVLLRSPHLNVNQSDRDGHTALSFAAKLGTEQMVSQLLQSGAYLNLTDHQGDTALIKATKHGHPNVVKILLAKFADVDIKGKDCKTALHIACEHGNLAIVRELLACSADIEAMNLDHETPLLRTVKEGTYEIVKLLLDHGADISASDKNYDTAIHCAVRSQNIPIVELLLRNPRNAKYLYQANKHGETPYDIDSRNKKRILPTLFGLKGFSAAAVCESATFDTSSCALAEMLTDPAFETPLSVGLFAKWGSSVSVMLDKVKNQVQQFIGLPVKQKLQPSWITFFIIVVAALYVGLLVAYLVPASKRITVGIVASLCLFFIPYSFIFLVHVGVQFCSWPWAESAAFILQRNQDYMKLLLQICFTDHQSSKSVDRKVKFIFAGGYSLSSPSSKLAVSDLVGLVAESVEHAYGKLAFRLARSFGKKKDSVNGQWMFKQFCCVPIIVWFLLFWFALLAISVIAVVLHGPNNLFKSTTDPPVNAASIVTPSQLTIVIYVLVCFSGGLLLLSAQCLYKMLYSLTLTPIKLQRDLGKQSVPYRPHIHKLCQAIQQLDSINNVQTRLCILLDCLEAQDIKLLLEIMEAVRSCFSIEPVITIFSADYNLLSQAIKQSSLYENGQIAGIDYLQNVIHLPVFFCEKKKHKTNGEPPESSHDASFGGGDVFMDSRSRHVKHFDLTKWLTTADRADIINPQLVKRIASVVSFSAKLLRADGKIFSWSSLSSWIVLSELWPYTATCLVALVENRSYESNKPIRSIYFESSSRISNSHSSDKASTHTLQTFLKSGSFSLTVRDLITYSTTAMNLDPKLVEFAPIVTDTLTHNLKAELKSGSSSLASSSVALDIPVTSWTVDEVCYRWKAIPGLNSQNFPLYDTFIRKNNFHGLAIASCVIEELKKELNAPFGDWCLIRRFILESKSRETGKIVSVSSDGESEAKSPPTIMKHSETLSSIRSLSSTTEGVSNFSGLAHSHRTAYDEAFKEYLKLQNRNDLASNDHCGHPDAIENDVNLNPVVASTSESAPLLQVQCDINAN